MLGLPDCRAVVAARAGHLRHGLAKFYAAEMTREEIKRKFADEGLSPHSWSNGANYFYAEHSHEYDKVLYCVQGEVTFHLKDGDIVLHPGQRVDIPAGTPHAATVGSDGAECMEAAVHHR